MRRRDFVKMIARSAVAWPLAARAQQDTRMRRIGVLMPLGATDAEAQARVGAFLQGLQEFGWAVGRNVRIEIRWTDGDADEIRKYASELATLAPDVILSTGSSTLGPLLRVTRAVPIVFVVIVDPVGAGYIASLARPGGNATGFTAFEYGLSAKWLEVLKQIAPGVIRAAVLRDPNITAGIGQFGAIRSAAPALGIDVSPVNLLDAGEIEHAVAEFARAPGGGLIVPGSALAVVHRKLIITLAARYKLPAVYWTRTPVTDAV